MQKILVLGLFLVLSGKVYAGDDHDFQVWNTDVEEINLNKSAKVLLEEEFRLGDNAGNFYYQHYDIGYVRDLSRYLNAGFGYRYVQEMKNKKFKVENEPYLMATLFWQWLGYKFASRSRLEYRYFQYQADSWRYRNKFTVKLPWEFTRREIQPFLADEIFIRFNGTELNENRLFIGLGFKITKNLAGEIYYLLRSIKNYHKTTTNSWTDADVLGSNLKLMF